MTEEGSECPKCGSTKGEWTDKAELYCTYCNWRIYPPDDRYLHPAARARRPKKGDIRFDFLDVDAVPGDAGQGGGPVMRHDGGHGGIDAAGESLRSLASRAPRASSRSTALPTWRASRLSPEWVSWPLTTAS